MDHVADGVKVVGLPLQHFQLHVFLGVGVEVSPGPRVLGVVVGWVLEHDFFLLGGQLSEHLLVLLLVLLGGLPRGFFTHSNHYYKRSHHPIHHSLIIISHCASLFHLQGHLLPTAELLSASLVSIGPEYPF